MVWVSAGVVFLVWWRRARVNAESFGGTAAQRRSRSWVVGGWFTPVANLWVPYQRRERAAHGCESGGARAHHGAPDTPRSPAAARMASTYGRS